jgi:hypothetical protein
LNATSNPDIYSLPRALFSQHSPYLTAACEKISHEKNCNTIKLKFDNASIFSLFNLWMYYGKYTTPTPSSSTGQSCSMMDIQAWVLGDKLQSVDFKNYVMTRLHQQYAVPKTSGPVTTTHFDYVCASTKPRSKLRQFFFDVVGTNLSNRSCVLGTCEEWDVVFQKYADARTFILRGFMMSPAGCPSVEPVYAYMENKPTEQPARQLSPAETASNSRTKTARSTLSAKSAVPAKRNADGVPVKEEPVGD